jgi:hypothetical protein
MPDAPVDARKRCGFTFLLGELGLGYQEATFEPGHGSRNIPQADIEGCAVGDDFLVADYVRKLGYCVVCSDVDLLGDLESTGTTACCVWNACPDLRHCGPCGETSRRAGCRRSARPVR